jgi:DNA repair protein RecN (Recombination protein N)
MLTALSIRNIVLIDKLDLDFGDGLGVLTGETGAGKSIVLEALGLALGDRADRGLVQQGSAVGSVSGVFEVAEDHPAHILLVESGFASNGQLILRRLVQSDGRSRAFINDQPASIGLLSQVGQSLVEIHGQHEARGLMDSSTHRMLLDDFGGHQKKLAEITALYADFTKANDELVKMTAGIEAAKIEAEYLRHSVAELEDLAAEIGEEDALANQRALMMSAEKIVGEIQKSHTDLSADAGVAVTLSKAIRRLERSRELATGILTPIVESLERASIEIDDAIASIASAIDAMEYDQPKLDETEARLFAVRAASRKYNTPADGLTDLRAEMSAKLALLVDGMDSVAELETQLATIRSKYKKTAKALTQKRTAAAKRLDKAVMAELSPLRMAKAVFETRIEKMDDELVRRHGDDQIEFQISTNPNTKAGPLNRVASGGELSRLSLALKTVLARSKGERTLIFDEVDQGVGGAVADAVGERLSKIAKAGQVLVVTHSPQVAARGDQHWRISKSSKTNGRVKHITKVEDLKADERREEIARMLAGAKVTDEARAAAEKLLLEGCNAGKSA